MGQQSGKDSSIPGTKDLTMKLVDLEEQVTDLLKVNKLLSDFISEEGLFEKFRDEYTKVYYHKKMLRIQ